MTNNQSMPNTEEVLPEDVPVAMPRLPAMITVSSPQQFKAMGDPTRTRILDIIQQKPATAKQIAQILKMSPGTISHHLQVLEEAGLVQVVARRLVHGIVAKYYTRTARIYNFDFPPEVRGYTSIIFDMLTHARDQLAEALATEDVDAVELDPLNESAFPRIRLSAERARYYSERIRTLVNDLVNEEPDPDGQVYALCVAFFKTPQYAPEQVTPVSEEESSFER